MKAIMLVEFGSTGAKEMSVFHALSAGNGMKPLRSAPGPRLIPAHVPLCEKLSRENKSNERPIRTKTRLLCIERLLLSYRSRPEFRWTCRYDSLRSPPGQWLEEPKGLASKTRPRCNWLRDITLNAVTLPPISAMAASRSAQARAVMKTCAPSVTKRRIRG